jgi:trigger factor
MADNETTAVAEQEEQAFQYDIKIEDAGPATKKVTVDIPASRIQEKLAQQFKELRRDAVLPGFRAGRAPQKLIEKKFSADVRDQVRRSLVSESYEQAVKDNKLEVIGEPEFDNPDAVKLPEGDASLNYTFTIEVQPEINLPVLTGVKVRKPKYAVTEENIAQAMKNLTEQQGSLVPVEDRGVQENDYLVADVHVKLDGNVVTHQHDAQLVARAGRIGGVPVEDLAAQLAGLKGGETRTIQAKAPDAHPNEQLRGKDVEIEVALKDIKRLEPAIVDQEFLESLGFENEQQLKDALKEQMDERIKFDVQEAMRSQVEKYLLDSVQIELPTKLSDRQADRVAQRRAMDLMMRGLPREQVESQSDALRSGAKDEAIQELKRFFILQKIAQDQNVDVEEAELNGRIAMLAAQRGQRPEKMKQEMSKDGSLSNLYLQLREQKAIDKIIETAEVEEFEPEQKQAE